MQEKKPKTAIGMSWDEAAKNDFLFTGDCAVSPKKGGYGLLIKNDIAHPIRITADNERAIIEESDVIEVLGYADGAIQGIFKIAASELQLIEESPSSSTHTQDASEHSASGSPPEHSTDLE